MYRLKKDHVEELEIKKSRFICYLHKTFAEADAKAFLLKVRKEHPDATHHCYAFVIGEHNEIQRSNDDGEPAGTAGVPMLECLTNRHMQDTLAVTVRYYGGTKLGAGGLIRAYSKSVAEALNTAVITKKETMQVYTLTFPYDFIGKLDYYFRSNNIYICDKLYDERLTYTYLCKDALDTDIQEITNGTCIPVWIEECIIDVELDQEKEIHP